MCGIVGILMEDARAALDVGGAARIMAASLRHRGPDDSGLWAGPEGNVALGFRRLAIQDLSDAGAQPMSSPSGRFMGVYNGEVYNVEELRARLPAVRYRGRSDTEVLLHAIEAWGFEETLHTLNGMFALGVWDREEAHLTLARDRMGIKPLYIARLPGGMAFASELRAFHQIPGFAPPLHQPAIALLLRHLFIPAPLTPLEGVTKLSPGHLLRISAQRAGSVPHPSRWWHPPAPSPSDAGPTNPVDALQDLLEDAVRLRLLADVPVGAFLSGGLDSSTIVALMQRVSSRPVQTFTIGFDDPSHDEGAQAAAVARHLGTDHNHHQVCGIDALDLVPRLAELFDEPLADPSAIPTHLVSQIARRKVTVALSGDGGDELFAGYTRHAQGLRVARSLGRLPRRGRAVIGRALARVPASTWHGLGSRGQGIRLPAQKAAKLGRMLQAPTPRGMYGTLISTTLDPIRLGLAEPDADTDGIRRWIAESDGSLKLQELLLLDQAWYLPDDLLHKVDRASMASGLEVRVPLLDHRIVEFARTLPEEHLTQNGQGKWLLRQVLLRYLPSELVDHPKTGFTVPLVSWLRGPLRTWAGDLLLSGGGNGASGLLDPTEIKAAWTRFHDEGRDEEAPGIWALAILEQWQRAWDPQHTPEPVS